MSFKRQRTETDIMRILSPEIRGLIRVELSADMSSAKVFIDGEIEEFEKRTSEFRSMIAQSLPGLRQTPNLKFFVDAGSANARRVEELLKKI